MKEYEMKNIGKLVDDLHELPVKLQRSAVTMALRKSANVIKRDAVARAKQFDDPKTNNKIWKNIKLKVRSKRVERKMGGKTISVGVLGGAKDMRKYGEYRGRGKANPGGDTFYWRFVEFGTEHSRAEPFMRPAMSTNVESAINVFVVNFKPAIMKQVDKL